MLHALRIALCLASLNMTASAVYLICATEAGRDDGAYAESAVLFWGDDAHAGAESARRVAHAAALWHAGRYRRLFCVGGRRARHQPSGAQQMSHMLIDAGVPENRIVVGGRSYDTVSNLAEVRELARDRSLRRVLLISDRLQVARIRWMLLPRLHPLRAEPAGYPPALTQPEVSFVQTWRRVQWEWLALASLLLPEQWRSALLATWRTESPDMP